MNVEAHHHAIAKIFAEALPSIADLLLADAGVEGHNKHTVVADLLVSARDNVLAFLNVRAERFSNIYCTAHGLTSFPAPSTPPLFRDDHPQGGGGTGIAAAATAQPQQQQAQGYQQPASGSTGMPMQLRGGSSAMGLAEDDDGEGRSADFSGGNDNVHDDDERQNSLSGVGRGTQPEEEPLIRDTGEGLFSYNNNDVGSDSTSDDDDATPAVNASEAGDQRVAFEYPDGTTDIIDPRGGVGAPSTTPPTNSAATPSEQRAPPAEQQVQANQNSNNNVGGDGNNLVDTAMAGGEGLGGDGRSTIREDLRTPQQRGGFGRINENAGITFSNVTRGTHEERRGLRTPLMPTQLFEQPVGAEATRKILRQINNSLIEIIEETFIQPRHIYRETTYANRRSTRIKKVVTAQKVTQKADAVADAVMQEARVDAKALEALVKDTAAEAVKAALEGLDLTSKKSSKPKSKNDKGGQSSGGKGGAQKKKKSTNSGRGGKKDGKGNSTAAKSNASPDASSGRNRSTSRGRSRGNNRSSTKKRGKSNGPSRRR